MDAITAAVPTKGGTVLPETQEEQVQLGCRMIESAFNAASAARDDEIRKLRVALEDAKSQHANFNRKNNAMESELHEINAQCSKIAEENKELFKDVRDLRLERQQLRGLKQKVLENLSGEVAVDAIADQSFNTSFMGGEGSYEAWSGVAAPQALTTIGDRSSIPKPAKPEMSQQPPDGKEFFRQARETLDLKSFQMFLSQIKSLNNNQQTKEETLKEVKRIFGGRDVLYRDFELLINKHSLGPM